MKISYIYGVVLGFVVLGHGALMCMQPKGQMVKFEVPKNDGNNKGLPRDVVIGGVIPPIRYSLSHMPREMQYHAFCQTGLSFDDKKNLSLVSKTLNQNIRDNVLQYRSVPSQGMIFAIDSTMRIADMGYSVGESWCSIL